MYARRTSTNITTIGRIYMPKNKILTRARKKGNRK